MVPLLGPSFITGPLRLCKSATFRDVIFRDGFTARKTNLHLVTSWQVHLCEPPGGVVQEINLRGPLPGPQARFYFPREG